MATTSTETYTEPSAKPTRPLTGLFPALVLAATLGAELLLSDTKGQGAPSKTLLLSLEAVLTLGAAAAWWWGRRTAGDLLGVVGVILLSWTLTTAKLGLVDASYWPSPGRTAHILTEDYAEFLGGARASLTRLGSGYLIGLALAVPLGLFVGWNSRLFAVISPITKFVAPIPPHVYIPFALVLLPSMEMAGILIIAVGVFWPVFATTLAGVHGVDRRYVEAARTLGASNLTILRRVVFPAALPSIFAGVGVGTILGFIMLTVAEGIGASQGLGYYLMYYKDIVAYDRVLADVLVIGAWVFVWTYGTERLERWALRWQRGGRA